MLTIVTLEKTNQPLLILTSFWNHWDQHCCIIQLEIWLAVSRFVDISFLTRIFGKSCEEKCVVLHNFRSIALNEISVYSNLICLLEPTSGTVKKTKPLKSLNISFIKYMAKNNLPHCKLALLWNILKIFWSVFQMSLCPAIFL